MKKVKRIGAIALGTVTLCTAVAFSGCTGFGRVKTEDEIYQALMNATQEFFGYEDEMTITMTMEEESVDVYGYVDNEKVEMKFSLHPEADKMFFTMKSGDTELVMKIFEESGTPYIYTKAKTETNTDTGNTSSVAKENYQITTQDCVDQFTGLFAFSNYAGINLQELFHTYSYGFTQVKSAGESIYAEQLAKERENNEDANATFKASVEKSSNKLICETFSQVTTNEYENTRNEATVTLTENEKIVGKKGKISELIATVEASYKRKNNPVKKSAKVAVDMKIDYSFDKKGYKAIETQLPESVTMCNFIQQPMQMKFNINGYLFTKSASSGHSFSSDSVFRGLSGTLQRKGYTIEYFEDGAYTKPFVPDNLSYKEFCKIDCVYGKLTVEDDYAVLLHDYTVCDERSDAYKAFFAVLLDSSEDEFKSVSLSKGATYSLPIYDGYKTFINGEAYNETTKDITLEEGKLYHVELAQVVTDEQFSIFELALVTAKTMLDLE